MRKKMLLLSVLFLLVISLFTNSVYANIGDTVKIDAILLNQDPDPAQPGDYLELRFKIEKTGNMDVSNLQFKLETKYPFSFDSSDDAIRNFGTWKGQSGNVGYYTLYYKLLVDDDAIKGDYELNLKYTFNDTGVWGVKKFDIRVGEKVKPNFILGTLITSPSKLLSDVDEAELSIEITNIGNGNAENVIFEMELPKGFTSTYAYSERANLGLISGGSTKIAKIYLDIGDEVPSGEHVAKVNISYKEENDSKNEYKTKTLFLDIPIKKKPKFEILSVDLIGDVEVNAGDKVSLKIKIKNVGSKDADSVSLRIFKDSTQPFEFIEKSDVVGNLKVGETGEAIIVFEVDKTAAFKKYILDLEIRSIDGDSVLLDNKSITVDVAKEVSKNSSNLVPIIVGIVILFLVIMVSYNFGKKKNLVKKRK
ncbi:MAG: hypothetical protein WCY27_00405 [archaeon]|nr:hypothetical protein [archaeon]MDD2477641.1 hypothetical protein [Candidatus ainarchaeum sp.]MDD3085052.1 hypothetical protein [Candidatus ainarchaeum sp.]MDD4220822.1 hypothetical protein [Candidatus ainarchaeum sp.]MDD4662322.1 hypothetical protein [Candidatus ainarchaeum sp.]